MIQLAPVRSSSPRLPSACCQVSWTHGGQTRRDGRDGCASSARKVQRDDDESGNLAGVAGHVTRHARLPRPLPWLLWAAEASRHQTSQTQQTRFRHLVAAWLQALFDWMVVAHPQA